MVIDGKTAYIMTCNFTLSALGGSSSTTNREYGIIDTESTDVAAVLGIFNFLRAMGFVVSLPIWPLPQLFSLPLRVSFWRFRLPVRAAWNDHFWEAPKPALYFWVL